MRNVGYPTEIRIWDILQGGVCPTNAMDTENLIELIPHYVAMLFLIFVVLGVVRRIAGEQGFWIDLVIIAVVVFSYRPLVLRLGIAPTLWES